MRPPRPCTLRQLRWFLPLIFIALLPGQPPKRQPFGNPRVTQYAPRRRYHVVAYRIRLRLHERRRAIAGAVTITLRPLAGNFHRFALDSAGLIIESVRLLSPAGPQNLRFGLTGPANPAAGAPARQAPARGAGRRAAGTDIGNTAQSKLWVTLPRAFRRGESLRVRIAYHATPQRGLTFLAPSARSPHRPVQVWSYGWPENNHYWFPCWDYPNDKAASETIITVPAGQSVVSNGKLLRVTRGAGLATYDWSEPVPHSSYLISIAAGQWTELRQHLGRLPVDAYVPYGVSLARASRSFGLTPDMIGFYSRVFGLDYPYAKYAQVAAHDFPGGLENISATTLTDLTLHSAAGEPDESSIGLVAHELAHQWFGDLVTERSWANAWLSEGFATFGAALYAGHHGGPHAYRYQIWLDQHAARAEDRRYRRPIVDRHYTHPWGILDRTTYEKGAAVLDMLRMTLDGGREPALASPREPLFRAFSAYLQRYRARNADTHDLINALRRSTGRNPRRFFDQWVYGAGYPAYRARASYDAQRKIETVEIAQTQKPAWRTARVFALPLELAFAGAAGQRQTAIVQDRRRHQTFTFPLAFAPRWVDFDPHDYILKSVDFPQSPRQWLAAANQDPVMMARLQAARQLGQARHCGCGVVKGLEKVLTGDAFYGVRVEAARSLGRLRRPAAMRALLQALQAHPAQAGHAAVRLSSRVRAAAVAALGNYSLRPPAFAQLARSLHADPSPAVASAAARALGRPGSPASYPPLAARWRSAHSYRLEAALIQALAATRDPRAPALLQQISQQAPSRMLRQMAKRLAASAAK